MWALIIDDVVVELTDVNPEGRFHPSLIWVSCSKSVKTGMSYKDGVFTKKEDE